MVPHIIDLRWPAKEIIRYLRWTRDSVVLIPEKLITARMNDHHVKNKMLGRQSFFGGIEGSTKVEEFYGWDAERQWECLDLLGLKEVVLNQDFQIGIETNSVENTSPSPMVGIFSSGTTNHAKCLWNRRDHLVQNATFSAEAFEVKAADRLLFMALPWHVAGITWAFMAEDLGAHYDFLVTRRGEEADWVAAIQRIKPNYLFTVPSALSKMYDHQWWVELVVFGGQPMSKNDYDKLGRHCRTTIQGYGQTEAGGLICVYKRESVRPLLKDEEYCQGNPIRGVNIKCSGTVDAPSTIEVLSPSAIVNEWYDTGDQGYLDEKGQLILIPRSQQKEMIG